MARTPTSFLEAEANLNEVVTQTKGIIDRDDSAVATIERSVVGLTQMQTDYASTITYINDQATANPSDPAWQDLERRAAKIATDFVNRRTKSTAMRDAVIAARDA